MQLARRASLLVAFYMLTSVATADAECAWVLWSASASASLPVGAWDTKSRCEEAKNERQRAVGSAVERTTVTFVCLPDTVDPRGAKGK
jgi:type IV secretory pathway protease TraF